MKSIILVGVITASVLLSGTPARAQSSLTCGASIADLMSAKEFEAAGLAALTPAQLGALSSWVDTYRRQITAADAEGGRVTAPAAAAIHSRIDGVFDGWEGKTIFKLANGQVWQQSGPGAKYFYANDPNVVISASYKLRVEGLVGEVAVRRIQ